ncbi:MAG TPA: hypothetical protein VIY49_28350 [Bryobacteraceae bacterium]
MARRVILFLLSGMALLGSSNYAHKERQMQQRDHQMDRALAWRAHQADHAGRPAPKGKAQ